MFERSTRILMALYKTLKRGGAVEPSAASQIIQIVVPEQKIIIEAKAFSAANDVKNREPELSAIVQKVDALTVGYSEIKSTLLSLSELDVLPSSLARLQESVDGLWAELREVREELTQHYAAKSVDDFSSVPIVKLGQAAPQSGAIDRLIDNLDDDFKQEYVRWTSKYGYRTRYNQNSTLNLAFAQVDPTIVQNLRNLQDVVALKARLIERLQGGRAAATIGSHVGVLNTFFNEVIAVVVQKKAGGPNLAAIPLKKNPIVVVIDSLDDDFRRAYVAWQAQHSDSEKNRQKPSLSFIASFPDIFAIREIKNIEGVNSLRDQVLTHLFATKSSQTARHYQGYIKNFFDSFVAGVIQKRLDGIVTADHSVQQAANGSPLQDVPVTDLGNYKTPAPDRPLTEAAASLLAPQRAIDVVVADAQTSPDSAGAPLINQLIDSLGADYRAEYLVWKKKYPDNKKERQKTALNFIATSPDIQNIRDAKTLEDVTIIRDRVIAHMRMTKSADMVTHHISHVYDFFDKLVAVVVQQRAASALAPNEVIEQPVVISGTEIIAAPEINAVDPVAIKADSVDDTAVDLADATEPPLVAVASGIDDGGTPQTALVAETQTDSASSTGAREVVLHDGNADQGTVAMDLPVADELTSAETVQDVVVALVDVPPLSPADDQRGSYPEVVLLQETKPGLSFDTETREGKIAAAFVDYLQVAYNEGKAFYVGEARGRTMVQFAIKNGNDLKKLLIAQGVIDRDGGLTTAATAHYKINLNKNEAVNQNIPSDKLRNEASEATDVTENEDHVALQPVHSENAVTSTDSAADELTVLTEQPAETSQPPDTIQELVDRLGADFQDEYLVWRQRYKNPDSGQQRSALKYLVTHPAISGIFALQSVKDVEALRDTVIAQVKPSLSADSARLYNGYVKSFFNNFVAAVVQKRLEVDVAYEQITKHPVDDLPVEAEIVKDSLITGQNVAAFVTDQNKLADIPGVRRATDDAVLSEDLPALFLLNSDVDANDVGNNGVVDSSTASLGSAESDPANDVLAEQGIVEDGVSEIVTANQIKTSPKTRIALKKRQTISIEQLVDNSGDAFIKGFPVWESHYTKTASFKSAMSFLVATLSEEGVTDLRKIRDIPALRDKVVAELYRKKGAITATSYVGVVRNFFAKFVTDVAEKNKPEAAGTQLDGESTKFPGTGTVFPEGTPLQEILRPVVLKQIPEASELAKSNVGANERQVSPSIAASSAIALFNAVSGPPKDVNVVPTAERQHAPTVQTISTNTSSQAVHYEVDAKSKNGRIAEAFLSHLRNTYAKGEPLNLRKALSETSKQFEIWITENLEKILSDQGLLDNKGKLTQIVLDSTQESGVSVEAALALAEKSAVGPAKNVESTLQPGAQIFNMPVHAQVQVQEQATIALAKTIDDDEENRIIPEQKLIIESFVASARLHSRSSSPIRQAKQETAEKLGLSVAEVAEVLTEHGWLTAAGSAQFSLATGQKFKVVATASMATKKPEVTPKAGAVLRQAASVDPRDFVVVGQFEK